MIKKYRGKRCSWFFITFSLQRLHSVWEGTSWEDVKGILTNYVWAWLLGEEVCLVKVSNGYAYYIFTEYELSPFISPF